MSSFNINRPSNRPQITEAQSMMNNGGAGNTGYMAQGKKKKKKDEDEFDPSILEGGTEDSFQRSQEEFEEDDDYYNTPKSSRGTSKENENKPKTGVKGVVFGILGKVAQAADSVIEKVSEKKTADDKDDNSGGGDFLTLSK